MFEYTPSNVFWADQGLPNDTEIDLDHETEYMYEFIALIVGDPISLWDLYKEYVKNPSRQFYARVKIDGIEFDDENIVEITLDETVNPDDSLTLGSVASSKLDITVYDIEGTNYTDATVTAEIGLEIEGDIAYVPLGVFTVDSVDKINNRINLTCFDNMGKMERPYVSNLTYPAPLNQVALEIAQQAGINLVTTLPNTFVDEIKGYTLRQAIGFVASFVGCFAKFNRNGDLEIISYRETNEMITADNYMDLQTQENEFVVGRITCKVSNDDGDFELVAGVGGTGIYFENPIMTQQQLDNLWNELKFLTYMPFDMRWQGNPLLSAGDKVQITDINNQIYSTLVMDQQLRYAGGLSATTSAKGKTETAQEFDFKGSLTERVERIERQQQESDPNKTPEKPSNITATGLFENIIVEWSFENARYINSYEVYASKIPNFVPNESNLVWLGKSGSFVFYAQLNETWYFKVRGINTHGVPGPFSDEASATTALIDGEYIEDATIGSAKIKNLAADKVISGSFSGQEFTGGTFKGAVFEQIGSAGRMVVDDDGLKIYNTQNDLRAAILLGGTQGIDNALGLTLIDDGESVFEINQDGEKATVLSKITLDIESTKDVYIMAGDDVVIENNGQIKLENHGGVSRGIEFPEGHIITTQASDHSLAIYPNVQNAESGDPVFRIRAHENRTNYTELLRIQKRAGGFDIRGGISFSLGENAASNVRGFHIGLVPQNKLVSFETDMNGSREVIMRFLGNSKTIRIGSNWSIVGAFPTTTSSSNMHVGPTGVLSKSSSSKKYKLVTENLDIDYRKVWELMPKSWYDKNNSERYAELLTRKHNGEDVDFDCEPIRRIPGLLAEDVHNAGLHDFVVYDLDGNIEGVMYDRLWITLIPITKDHEIKLTQHEQELLTLKNRVSELESEVEALKGVS